MVRFRGGFKFNTTKEDIRWGERDLESVSISRIFSSFGGIHTKK